MSKRNWLCPCFDYHKLSEFWKIAEVIEKKVIIYKHLPRDKGQLFRDSNKGVYIVHNYGQFDVQVCDILFALEKQKSRCNRCIVIIDHLMKILQQLSCVRREDIIGVCEYCFRMNIENKSCLECTLAIRKFIDAKSSLLFKDNKTQQFDKPTFEDTINNRRALQKSPQSVLLPTMSETQKVAKMESFRKKAKYPSKHTSRGYELKLKEIFKKPDIETPSSEKGNASDRICSVGSTSDLKELESGYGWDSFQIDSNESYIFFKERPKHLSFLGDKSYSADGILSGFALRKQEQLDLFSKGGQKVSLESKVELRSDKEKKAELKLEVRDKAIDEKTIQIDRRTKIDTKSVVSDKSKRVDKSVIPAREKRKDAKFATEEKAKQTDVKSVASEKLKRTASKLVTKTEKKEADTKSLPSEREKRAGIQSVPGDKVKPTLAKSETLDKLKRTDNKSGTKDKEKQTNTKLGTPEKVKRADIKSEPQNKLKQTDAKSETSEKLKSDVKSGIKDKIKQTDTKSEISEKEKQKDIKSTTRDKLKQDDTKTSDTKNKLKQTDPKTVSSEKDKQTDVKSGIRDKSKKSEIKSISDDKNNKEDAVSPKSDTKSRNQESNKVPSKEKSLLKKTETDIEQKKGEKKTEKENKPEGKNLPPSFDKETVTRKTLEPNTENVMKGDVKPNKTMATDEKSLSQDPKRQIPDVQALKKGKGPELSKKYEKDMISEGNKKNEKLKEQITDAKEEKSKKTDEHEKLPPPDMRKNMKFGPPPKEKAFVLEKIPPPVKYTPTKIPPLPESFSETNFKWLKLHPPEFQNVGSDSESLKSDSKESEKLPEINTQKKSKNKMIFLNEIIRADKAPWSPYMPEIKKDVFDETENIDQTKNMQTMETKKMPRKKPEYGGINYALSDPVYIFKGWTLLPTEKIVKKTNVYKMTPAHPEFDWFHHNRNKGQLCYDTGEPLAKITEDGLGKWFYRNGKVALHYYSSEDINAQQRYVVYSNGEPDDSGRSWPVTVLASFDYLGNGVIYDHSGNIRLKYNQTEGIVLDRSLGPSSHWKWHSLNDPPVYQRILMDTYAPYKDPLITSLGKNDQLDPDKPRVDDEEVLAVEFDNSMREKRNKVLLDFKPFQIKMKALKLNNNFSLRILDQANVILMFRDGRTTLKLNIGMLLNHKEIIDTEITDIGAIANPMENLPAKTDSIAKLQNIVGKAYNFEKARFQKESWLRPSLKSRNTDKKNSILAAPLRPSLGYRCDRSSRLAKEQLSLNINCPCN